MKVKTSELTARQLDWAVATCEGLDYFEPDMGPMEPEYSTDWTQGGPIVERERLAVWWCDAILNEDDTVHSEECWYAELSEPTEQGNFGMTGPTPLVAAMRCYVASKLGDTVELPEELL